MMDGKRKEGRSIEEIYLDNGIDPETGLSFEDYAKVWERAKRTIKNSEIKGKIIFVTILEDDSSSRLKEIFMSPTSYSILPYSPTWGHDIDKGVFISGKDYYKMNMEPESITKQRMSQMQEEKLKENIQKAKELLEANGFEVKEKSKYINGELGVIDIDGFGCRIYEDVVHDLGDGYCSYYIQQRSQEGIIIPEHKDIPQELWGKKVNNHWIKFRKEI